MKTVKNVFAVINDVSLLALVMGIPILVSGKLPFSKRIGLYTVCIASGMILLPIAAGLGKKIAKRFRKQENRAAFVKPRAQSSYSKPKFVFASKQRQPHGRKSPVRLPVFLFL